MSKTRTERARAALLADPTRAYADIAREVSVNQSHVVRLAQELGFPARAATLRSGTKSELVRAALVADPKRSYSSIAREVGTDKSNVRRVAVLLGMTNRRLEIPERSRDSIASAPSHTLRHTGPPPVKYHNPVTAERKRKAVALRSAGIAPRMIAEHLGVSEPLVHYYLKSGGYKGEPKPQGLPPEQQRLVARYYNAGYTTIEIVRRTGLPQNKVAWVVKKYRERANGT